jgi:DNA-directed RNA polymerase subunit RPC12/RpoP
MDIYKCEKCEKIFDEFEMDYKQAQIDKKELCDYCRKQLIAAERAERSKDL